MNNKGMTYVELLCALGIGAAITAATVTAVTAAKDKSVEMCEQHVETYENIDHGATTGEDIDFENIYSVR